VPYLEYDAYDNLTWADLLAYQQSSGGNPDGMATVVADEQRRIDDNSRRYALMRDMPAVSGNF
jgi:hypothetical protein